MGYCDSQAVVRFTDMGEREEYLAKAVEAVRLAQETTIGALRETLIEMAKGYRLLAFQAAAAAAMEA